MIIAVNARLLLPDKLEGIGRFACETLKIITREHPEHRFVFIFDRRYSDEFIFSDNITPVCCFPPARHPLLWYWFFEFGVPSVLNKFNANLFLSPDGWLSLRTNIKSLPVIHDLNFIHYPQFIPGYLRLYYNYFFPRFATKAFRIATVSEYSRTDIVNAYGINPAKIDLVYNGANTDFKPIGNDGQDSTRKTYTGGCPYFLFVGLIHPRKNISNLIRAFDAFRKDIDTNVKLLIVGSRKWWTEDMQLALDECSCKEEIIFTGRVHDEDLKKIVASALSLVYPSFFEGFGIPVLEAMNCDVPVICSQGSSLPEVGGEAVYYINPWDIGSMKTAMERMLIEPDLRSNLIEKARHQREKFTWEKTADLLWESVERSLVDC